MTLNYSDFEKQVLNKNVRCADCAHCEVGITGWTFAKCNGIPKEQESHVGAKLFSGDFISILIGYDRFPNKNGNCPYYKKKWWKFWVK